MTDRFKRDRDAFALGDEDVEWWVTAWIECPICNHAHVSVHPITCTVLECSQCGYMIPWSANDDTPEA